MDDGSQIICFEIKLHFILSTEQVLPLRSLEKLSEQLGEKGGQGHGLKGFPNERLPTRSLESRSSEISEVRSHYGGGGDNEGGRLVKGRHSYIERHFESGRRKEGQKLQHTETGPRKRYVGHKVSFKSP